MPAPSPPVTQNYQVYPFFEGYTGNAADSCATPQTYLLPPSLAAGEASVVQLPFLFTGAAGEVGKTCENSFFALKFRAPGSPVEPEKVITEVTAKATIWACNPTVRAELRAKFVEFLQLVEALEGTVLVGGGARRIAIALADRIPAPPADTLFFRYGLNPESKTAPYVDLTTGMRLRVQAEASQFVSPSSPSNLYLPAGELSAEVGTAGGGSGRTISFDPFLRAIRAPTVEGPSTTPALAGGLVDLAPVGGARSHWRLFVPRSVGSPAARGKLTVEGNFALVGANSLAALEAATASYPKPPTGGEAPLYLIFGGRAVVVPEIPVWITVRRLTAMEYVPLGTALADLAERYAPLPLDPAQVAVEIQVSRPTTARPQQGNAGLEFFTSGLGRVEPQLLEVPLIVGDSVTLSPKGW